MILAALLTLAIGGCGPAKGPASPTKADVDTSVKAEALTADQVLRKLIDTYANAQHYQDRARVRLTYKQEGDKYEDEAPLSVCYSAPNKLRVRAYQVQLASDGDNIYARVIDEASRNLDQQFVERAAPKSLSLDYLYEDEVLSDLISRGLGRHPAQLELLLGKSPLAIFSGDKVKRKLLPEETLDGKLCLRLEVQVEEGPFVLWIDKRSFLLHRLEYPTESLKGRLPQEGVSDLRLWAEFFNASFGPPSPDGFSLERPGDAKVVTRFVTPPQPLASTLFGRQPKSFHFAELKTGARVDQQSIRGQIVVLTWFSNHPAGRAFLEELELVRATLPAGQAKFIAVCTEPTETSDEGIAELMREWGCSMRVVRDTQAQGRDVFRINLLPTMVVLDEKGVLHVLDEGVNPNLAEELPKVLGMLKRGENVAASVLQQAENDRLVYQRALVAAGADAAEIGDLNVTPVTTLPARTRPFELQMEKLWSVGDISEPGNLLTLRDGASTRIIVHEGWDSLVELDADGKVVQRIALDLPEGATVSFLRSVRVKSGARYYLVADILGRQAHVFDDDWKRLLSYPPADQKHEGIRDATIADLDADGKPEAYVGFWSLLGAQGVGLDGKRLWSNRICSSVKSMAVSGPNPLGWKKLLLAGDTGAIHQLNQFGKHDPPIRAPGGFVDQIFAAEAPAGAASFCAIGPGANGKRRAIGLDTDFREVWNYDLPGGRYSNRLQFVASGRLLDEASPAWIFVGPDGSVHVISADGAFNDFFYLGEEIRGVAAAHRSGQALLMFSTKSRVVAHAIRRPAQDGQ